MKYTFIGHQSWLIEEGDTKILLDPLLMDTFGMDDSFGIEVVPPRSVDVDYLSDVNALILSHEHSDHFHLPSLNLLPRSAPVFVGVLTLEPVVKSIEALGFEVIRLRSTEEVELGNIRFKVYQAHPKTVIWESRVYQVLFTSLLEDYSLFIAVDALISNDFQEDVKSREVDRPNTIMVSNNSQIPPQGVVGALDNTSVPLKENKGRVGPLALRLVKEIVIDYSDLIEDLRHIVLCGGGFMKSADTFGQFMMSSQDKIADLAQPIFPEKLIVGAVPGKVFTNDYKFDSEASWIKENTERAEELMRKYALYQDNPVWEMRSLVGEGSDIGTGFDESCKKILSVLVRKHLQLLSSEFGRVLLSYGQPEAVFEVELMSICKQRKVRYGYNPLRGTVQLRSADEPAALFGIRAIAADLVAVIEGDIQIWDIAGLSIITWYDNDLGRSILYSPMVFLYAILGEHFETEKYMDICMKSAEKVMSNEVAA